MLRPSSGGWNVKLNPLFHLPVLVPRAMFNGCQLSPVNFPSESSPLPSLGTELTLFGYVTGSNQRLYPLYHVFLWTSVYLKDNHHDKHGDKDEDNSLKNLNNVHNPIYQPLRSGRI